MYGWIHEFTIRRVLSSSPHSRCHRATVPPFKTNVKNIRAFDTSTPFPHDSRYSVSEEGKYQSHQCCRVLEIQSVHFILIQLQMIRPNTAGLATPRAVTWKRADLNRSDRNADDATLENKTPRKTEVSLVYCGRSVGTARDGYIGCGVARRKGSPGSRHMALFPRCLGVRANLILYYFRITSLLMFLLWLYMCYSTGASHLAALMTRLDLSSTTTFIHRSAKLFQRKHTLTVPPSNTYTYI